MLIFLLKKEWYEKIKSGEKKIDLEKRRLNIVK